MFGDGDLLLHAVCKRARDERHDGEDDERHRVGAVEDGEREVRRHEEQVVHEQVHDAEPDAPKPRFRLDGGDEDAEDEHEEARLELESDEREPERGGDSRHEQQRHHAEVARGVPLVRIARASRVVRGCLVASRRERFPNAAQHGEPPPRCSGASILGRI